VTAGARDRAIAAFEERFSARPRLVARAPGRVNLIGDHTDYNEGFVLPMAIDRAVWIALRPRTDARVLVYSLDFDRPTQFDLGQQIEHGTGWEEYVRGIAWALRDGNTVVRQDCGWEGVVVSDVPSGAGLSSSAALELATARAFLGVWNRQWSASDMARVAQRAENEWVGVNCGIMDQLISAAGEENHALLIDCRSLATRTVALPEGAIVMVLDTATRRGLVDSAYNERRAQCEGAARFFGVRSLRDVEEQQFDERAGDMDPIMRKRARHVITENARTVAAAAALEDGDLAAVGRLMNESHASLRDDFEVSRAELDTMVSVARSQKGVYGARMTGAGFGGCTVALVERDAAPAVLREVRRLYAAATGLVPALYPCSAAAGASIEAA
jgi:galactokinase